MPYVVNRLTLIINSSIATNSPCQCTCMLCIVTTSNVPQFVAYDQ